MPTCELCQEDNPEDAVICAGCSFPLPQASDAGVLTPGAVLSGGRYRVGKILGRGGFGITYLGSDIAHRRPVAIKEFFPDGARRRGSTVLPPAALAPEDFDKLVEQYVSEGELIRRFTHPGIVVVHDVVRENQTAYMVMEYHAVPDLGDVLQDGPMDIGRAVRYAEVIAAALGVLHDGGVLHRDVKPANILVYEDGRAVLIDFGTAREFTSHTRRMTTLLTPGYAPLEQYTERGRRGPYSDIYSLAGTLYHMLTGQRPVPATDRAVGIDFPRVRDLRAEVPVAVDDAIHQALSMQVTHRPQNVTDFVAALHAETASVVPAEPEVSDETPTSRMAEPPPPKAPSLVLPSHDATWRLKGHEALVTAVVVTADGRLAASGGWDGSIRLWDLEHGGSERWVNRLRLPSAVARGPSTVWVWDVAFEPSEKTLAAACEDRCVRILDVENGEVLRSIPLRAKPSALAFSPDGQRLAVATADHAIRSFEPQSGRETGVMQEHQGRIGGLAFSPDGFLLASAAEDGTVRLWEAAAGRQLYRIAQGDRKALDVCFSPDGQLIAAAFDSLVVVLDTFSAQERQHLTHDAAVPCVTFSPDSAYVVAGTEQRQVNLWGTTSGKLVCSLEPHGGKVMSIAWARGVLVTGGGDKFIRVWRLSKSDTPAAAPVRAATPFDRPTGLFRGHWAPVRTVAFTPDGQHLVTGSEDRTIRQWDRTTGKEVKLAEVGSAVMAVATGEGCVVAAGEDSLVRLYDSESWGLVRTLAGHQGPVRSAAMPQRGRLLATGGSDGQVLLWSQQSDTPVLTLSAAHTGEVTSVAFYPDGRWLMSCSDDRTVCMWDTGNGKLLGRITGHASGVCCVAVSNSGELVVTASFDRTVRLWPRGSNKEIRRFIGHTSIVRSVAMSPDGRWLVSGSDDRTLRFWETATGQERHRIDLRGSITQLVCAPDGEHVVWACFEPTVRLLKVEKFVSAIPVTIC